MTDRAIVNTIQDLITSGDVDALLDLLPTLVVGDEETPEIPTITSWDCFSVYLHCFVAKKDLVNAKIYADKLIATAGVIHTFEFPVIDTLLDFILLAADEVGNLDPQLDDYKKFIEDYSTYVVSWSPLVLKFYNILWLNEADALLTPPTYQYFQLLLEAINTVTPPGCEELHERMVDCLIELGTV